MSKVYKKGAKSIQVIRSTEQERIALINFLEYPICFEDPLLIDNISAWVEHIPFGLFIVDLLRPKTIVELGTHSGVSYSAFCQAVKKLGLDTSCYAVDTWEGDAQAGFYGAEILSSFRTFHDEQFGDFSKLLQNTFDDAVKYFSDDSIDLLHIDGLHTYEAVKHDFLVWLPKISRKGVVLFHDISERENDFGVWQLWEELKALYPHFELFHGHGLGILAVGPEYPATLNLLLKSKENAQKIRDFFYLLGKRFELEQNQNRLMQKLLEYESSRSWRLTHPLRSLKKLLRI